MVQIRNMSKQFGDKIIFDNFNLNIAPKSFVVITGESGAGKSTLLNIIGGLEKINSGQVVVAGCDITNGVKQKDFYSTKIGFLFQNFVLMENKTVLQNLEIIQKKFRNQVNIDDILSDLNLNNIKNKKVYELSGGEQQRIALARLMIKKCELILCDEPTGSLDEKNGGIVLDILHQLNRQDKTIILVTHDKRIIQYEKNIIKI
jgi:putative ABC transport system ATP-binding protein